MRERNRDHAERSQKMMSLAIIVAVLLRNALTRQAPGPGKGNGDCRRTKEAFLKQTCGAAASK